MVEINQVDVWVRFEVLSQLESSIAKTLYSSILVHLIQIFILEQIFLELSDPPGS